MAERVRAWRRLSRQGIILFLSLLGLTGCDRELALEVKGRFTVTLGQQEEQRLRGAVYSEPGATVEVRTEGGDLVLPPTPVDDTGVLLFDQLILFDGRYQDYKISAVHRGRMRTIEVPHPLIRPSLLQRGHRTECVAEQTICKLHATPNGIKIWALRSATLSYSGERVEVQPREPEAELPVDFVFLAEGHDFAQLFNSTLADTIDLTEIEVKIWGSRIKGSVAVPKPYVGIALERHYFELAKDRPLPMITTGEALIWLNRDIGVDRLYLYREGHVPVASELFGEARHLSDLRWIAFQDERSFRVVERCKYSGNAVKLRKAEDITAKIWDLRVGAVVASKVIRGSAPQEKCPFQVFYPQGGRPKPILGKADYDAALKWAERQWRVLIEQAAPGM